MGKLRQGREPQRTFLGRLGRDIKGNVIAMAAAALIPLLAMIGGSIDASRFYMARTRLQQACDAGALAGRKAMASITTLSDDEKAKAKEFFDFNFPVSTYSAQNITGAYSKGADGVVVGAASADVPTTIMKFFGFSTLHLAVTCESTLNIPNTDVMFVVDVTGSMGETPSGDTQSKISGLKQAVKDFYSALGPGSVSGPGRVRYGFVPYSSNVNVGRILYAANPAFLAGGSGTENWEYDSRVALTTVDHYITAYGTESAQTNQNPTTDQDDWSSYTDSSSVGGFPASYSNLTTAQCSAKAVPGATSTVGNYSTPSLTGRGTVTYPNTTQTSNYKSTANGTDTQYRYTRKSNGTCQLQKRTRSTTTTRPSTTTRSVTWANRDKFDKWDYRKVTTTDDHPIDVSLFVQNTGSVTNPAYYSGYYTGDNPNSGGTPATFTWGGCIEEASTVDSIVATSSLTPPSNANDLNIDLVPNSIATKWKPFLRELQYDRSKAWLGDPGWIASGYAACPREASRLTMYASDYVSATKTSASFNGYVDSLTAIGGTYHDIGMIWGARFLSPDGIFASDNSDNAAPGGYQISRHIVFMTDGTLDTRNNANDPWGINNLDHRIAPASTDSPTLNTIHQRRTEIICNSMKAKGFTVWVIGFGIPDLSQSLKDCATDADHWSVASNSAALRARFSAIAQTIGGLRLSS